MKKRWHLSVLLVIALVGSCWAQGEEVNNPSSVAPEVQKEGQSFGESSLEPAAIEPGSAGKDTGRGGAVEGGSRLTSEDIVRLADWLKRGSPEQAQNWPVQTQEVVEYLRGQQGRPKDVLLLFDVSGSMLGRCSSSPYGLSALGQAVQAAREIVRNALEPGDLVMVAEFDHAYRLRTENLIEPGRFDTGVLTVPVSSDLGTNLFYGHHMAIKDLLQRRRADSWPCVIVLTDGYLDPPAPGNAAAKQLFEAYTGGGALEAYIQEASSFGNSLGIGARVQDGLLLPNARPASPLPVAEFGALAGYVRDAERNAPIDGAEVKAVGYAGQAEYPGQTDVEGLFLLTGLAPDGYRVTISRRGYEPILLDQVAVQAGLLSDCGIIDMRPREGPWRLLGLVLCCIAGAAALLFLLRSAGDMLRTRGGAGQAWIVKDEWGQSSLDKSRSWYNVEVDPNAGEIRVGDDRYGVRWNGKPLGKGQAVRLGRGKLEVYDGDRRIAEIRIDRL